MAAKMVRKCPKNCKKKKTKPKNPTQPEDDACMNLKQPVL
jgi:hypothetical protein